MYHDSKESRAFILLVTIFAGSLTIASILAVKIIAVAGFFVPAGVLAYSVTFICTDVISEMWGKTRAQHVVLGGFVMLSVVLGLVQISLFWPEAPFWKEEDAFQTILGSTSRIIVASFIAYIVSQFHDVWAFHLWKEKFKGKYLWFRNNLSTASSQLIDSLTFAILAFAVFPRIFLDPEGVLPMSVVWEIVLTTYVLKLMVAMLDTPFIYFSRNFRPTD